ncbi:MAG: CHAT domain-containing tetratricopeptide repeat protein [Candidatus Krumholzibacteriia bacterium]
MDRRRPLAALLGLLLAAGAPAASAAPAPLVPPRAAVLARADSLHAARAVAAADSLLTRELDRARAAADEAYTLELLVRHGRLLVSYGQAARGAPLLDAAVALADARADSLNLARAVRWLSVAEGMAGRSAEAGVLYRQLLDIAVARRDSLHEGWALVGLGWEDLNRGLLDEARGHYARAVALFAAVGDHDAEIWARNGYGIVLQRLGDFPAALALYRELAATAQRTGATAVEAMACNNTGSLLHRLGDPGTAIAHYERARALQLSVRQTREAVIPALNIAVCQIDLGELEDAATLLGELDALCAAEGFPDLRADVLYELARVRAAQGRLLEAAALHRRGAGLGVELPVASQVRHVTGLGRVLADLDSTEAALATVTAGRTALRERTRGSERLTLDLAWGERLADAGQTGVALTVLDEVACTAADAGLTGFRISARTRGGELHHRAARPDSALAWLRLAATAWEEERGVPADPRWREQRGAYGQRIYPLLAELLLADTSAPDAAHAAVHGFKARTLLEAMLGPGTAAPAASADSPGATPLRALQEDGLRTGEVFLDFYLGPERSFLFAATRTQRRAVRLPGLDRLAEPLATWRDLLRTAGPQADLAAAGRRLADVLLGEAADLIDGADAILWAPDGPLHGVPLACLPRPGAGPAAPLLAETHAVTRVPSAAALRHLRQQAPGPSPVRAGTILAVAGSRGADGAPLPGTLQEVRALARDYRGVRILADPVPADLLGEPPDPAPAIVHLAAHAVADAQHPWRAAFVLGGIEGQDRLSAAAVARCRLPYALAVLAGCESLGSRAVAGEGQLGLSTAFLAAGVPTVAATLWPVSDAAAQAFAHSFYGALAEGATATAALRTARRELRAEPGTARPAAWAAFVLVGDGEARFALARRRHPERLAGWGAALLLAAAGGGVALARRRRVRAR